MEFLWRSVYGMINSTLSHQVIGCAIAVHKYLGPGLLESTYRECLSHELTLNHIQHITEATLAVEYKGVHLDVGYRLDFLIEDTLILELKSVKAFDPIHEAQVISYLKLSGLPLALLINFNTRRLVEGIKRFVN